MATVWLSLPVHPVAAQQVTYSGSVGVATGDYIFTGRTTTWSMLSSLTARLDRIELSLSVPVVTQNSTAISMVAGIPIPTGGPDNTAVRRRQQGTDVPMGSGSGGTGSGGGGGQRRGSGGLLATPGASPAVADASTDTTWVAEPGAYTTHLGDPMLGVGASLLEGRGLLRGVTIRAQAKAPVATLESGVGTGRWDWAGGASFTLGAGGMLLFADATWWVLGDLPDLPLRDGLSWSASAGRLVGARWSVLASLSGAHAIVPGVAAPLEAGMFVNRRIGAAGSVSAGGSVGLSESSPGNSLWIGWSTRLPVGAAP